MSISKLPNITPLSTDSLPILAHLHHKTKFFHPRRLTPHHTTPISTSSDSNLDSRNQKPPAFRLLKKLQKPNPSSWCPRSHLPPCHWRQTHTQTPQIETPGPTSDCHGQKWAVRWRAIRKSGLICSKRQAWTWSPGLQLLERGEKRWFGEGSVFAIARKVLSVLKTGEREASFGGEVFVD